VIRKKKALSAREIKTEKILQEQLPEYIIRANMRLADVIHAGKQFKFMQGYHLDFVICDQQGDTIAAIELDDSYHDTEDGKRKDNHKNRWMAEAKIKLIRIREPEEAQNIRDLIANQEIPDPKQFAPDKKQKTGFAQSIWKPSAHKILSMPEASEGKLRNNGWTPPEEGKIYQYKSKDKNLFGRIMIFLISAGLMVQLFSCAGNNLKKKTEQAQQEYQHNLDKQKEIQQKALIEEQLRKQQQAKQATEQRNIETPLTPRYERVVVPGKSARECAINGVITNESILCMKNHYEMVLVSGNQ